jgi:hypothetical protein
MKGLKANAYNKVIMAQTIFSQNLYHKKLSALSMYNYSAKIIFMGQSHVAESSSMDPKSKF